MANYSIKILDSIDKLVGEAESWNSLWSRTGDISPLARAESIALWMRRFAPDAAFRAIVIEAEGTAVAGIPLHLQRRAKILKSGGLQYGGHLLCDAARQDTEMIFFYLIKGLKQLPIDFLWCDGIRYEDFPWKNFSEYWTNLGYSSRTIQQYHTAVIPLHGDPETVAATWGKKELADIKRRFRKRYTPENHEFRIVSNADEIAALLPDCFAIEHAGWKGQANHAGSIIKQGSVEYYLTQARILAEQHMTRLYALFVDGRMIAFQYGYLIGKTVFSEKISYDPTMREFAPGLVLRWLIYQSLLESQSVDDVDCMGIAGAHQKIWNPELHAVGEVVFPLSFSGIIALSLHQLYGRMKVQPSSDVPPKINKIVFSEPVNGYVFFLSSLDKVAPSLHNLYKK